MADTPKLQPWSPTQERLATPIIQLMTTLNVWAYRLTGGWLGGTFRGGAPVCLLTTIGKRSGQPRTVALLYLWTATTSSWSRPRAACPTALPGTTT